MRFLAYSVLVMLAISCQHDGAEENIDGDHALMGIWLYTEYGWSPGGGYFTETVPQQPPQTLTFHPDLRLSTNIEGLHKYKFYRIIGDAGTIVAFYEEDPGDEPQDETSLKHSYSIQREGNALKLYYRWCIEGCHLGFKRISQIHETDG